MKEAISKSQKATKEKNAYDSVWLFLIDNWPQLKEAFELIESEGFNLLILHCMEHWFILHFESGRAFQRKALRHLRDLWPAYHKTKLNHYALLKELSVAVERANRINKREHEIPVLKGILIALFPI